MTGSKPPIPPRPAGPTGPKPQAPSHPTPTHPPSRPARSLPLATQGHLPPAVRDQGTAPCLSVPAPGRPGQTTHLRLGEEPTPGSAAAPARATRESTGFGRAGAGESFQLPPIPTVPSFDNGPRFVEGEHRLYGRVEQPSFQVGTADYYRPRAG